MNAALSFDQLWALPLLLLAPVALWFERARSAARAGTATTMATPGAAS